MVQYDLRRCFLLTLCTQFSFAIDLNDCADVADLGTANLEKFDYTVDMTTKTVDDAGNKVCSYQLDVAFKHDEDLPIPDNPPVQCTPGPDAPIALDGKPYYDFRWSYEQVPEHIKKATGIDHISVDFNPCGHPPLGAFSIPHYDIHYYRVDPKYRSCMICEKKFPTPVCDPDNQTTTNGKAFFEIKNEPKKERDTSTPPVVSNMPAGFNVGMDDMVPFMGGHAWDISKQPSPDKPWVEPTLVMGTYANDVAFFEMMVPYSFTSGDKDTFFEEERTYEGQTIKQLPSSQVVSYSADTKLITVTLKGITDCELIETKDKTGETSGKSSVSLSLSLVASVVAVLFAL